MKKCKWYLSWEVQKNYIWNLWLYRFLIMHETNNKHIKSIRNDHNYCPWQHPLKIYSLQVLRKYDYQIQQHQVFIVQMLLLAQFSLQMLTLLTWEFASKIIALLKKSNKVGLRFWKLYLTPKYVMIFSGSSFNNIHIF